jgi:hypothetical protein
MPVLENAAQAIIASGKFLDYILDPSSAKGAHKARVFRAALGFTRLNHPDLIDALRQGIMENEAVLVREDRHGRHYRVEMVLRGPSGGSARVITGWIYDRGSDVPRLTTAFVA